MRRDGERLLLDGPVTLANAADLAPQAEAFLRDGVGIVDFAGVSEVDSGAVALALEWRRDALARGKALSLVNLPEAMRNLATLYGVAELVSDAGAAGAAAGKPDAGNPGAGNPGAGN